MNYTDSTMITLWHPVMLDSTFELPDFHEDMMTLWNLSDAFLPEMDQAGNMLTFGVGPEGFPADWTFTPVDHMGYTHWEVTPPANFSGMAMVNVTAQDTNGVMAYHMFEIDVMGVNDAPVIQEVIFEEMSYMPEWVNVTEMLNVTGVEGNFSWLVELEIDEDQMDVNFTVNATDLETDHANLTRVIDDTISEGIEVEWNLELHQNNVTIDENLYGHFLVNYSVIDDDDEPLDTYVWILFTVAAVNDPPMGEFGDEYEMRFEVLTEEAVNVSVTVSDVDMDELTVIWKIDGVTVDGWNELYFLYNWTTEGLYNISAEVSDGTVTYEIGYFHVNVTIANTAPVISNVQAYPLGMDPLDLIDFWLKGEVEEGEDVTLMCTATDGEGDDLTYTWTNDQDTSWTATGATVTVSADDLQKGLSYTFTCTVSDGIEEVSDTSNTIKIVEKDDDGGGLGVVLIIVVVVILLIILLIIILVVVKGKKKEEEVPEEPMGEEMPPEEGMEGEEMPEGMEEPMPEEPMGEEMPVEEEVPAEEPVEQPVEEEMPVPPAPAPPEQPMPPMPPQ
jgi:hypothetical protein